METSLEEPSERLAPRVSRAPALHRHLVPAAFPFPAGAGSFSTRLRSLCAVPPASARPSLLRPPSPRRCGSTPEPGTVGFRPRPTMGPAGDSRHLPRL